MSVLSPKAESLLTTLASRPGVTQQHMDGLRDAITSSPALVDLFNDTLANSSGSKPELTSLGLLPPGSNFGARYDPSTGALNLNLDALLKASSRREQSGELTFLFAHELEHARNASQMADAWMGYHRDAWKVAYTGDEPPRDYSAPLETYLNQTRWDEASAQVRGLNILADRLLAEGRSVDPTELHALGGSRMLDYFDYDQSTKTATWKPGYTPNPDNTLTLDAGNQAAIDQHYYNKPPQILRMGTTGHSDYPNYYAATALQVIANAEQAAHRVWDSNTALPISLDMGRLGLRPELLNCNGINLGGSGRTLAIQDTGDPNLPFYALPHHVPAPNVPHGLHGPAAPGSVTLPPPMAPMTSPPTLAPAGAGPATSQLGQPATLAELPMAAAPPSHHQRADPLLAQIQGKVAQLDAAQGKPWDQHSANLSASLYASAREHGFERVDHVLLSQATATQPAGANVFLVQGSPDDPAHRRAQLPTAEAVAAPESQSLQRAQALEAPQHAVHPLQAQQQEQSQQAAMRHH